MQNKLKYKIADIEKAFNIKLKRKCLVLGLDTASRTGYCLARAEGATLTLSVGTIDVDVSKITDKYLRNQIRYDQVYTTLSSMINNKINTLVIEDVYFSRNVFTVILLARIGAIAYTLGKIKGIKNIIWKTAVQARKALGLQCNKKKEVVQKEFCDKLKTNITDIDVLDAIILSLNGLTETK